MSAPRYRRPEPISLETALQRSILACEFLAVTLPQSESIQATDFAQAARMLRANITTKGTLRQRPIQPNGKARS